MIKILRMFPLLLIFSGCNWWSSSKLLDLDFIHTTILENHPGVYNTEDPNFKNHLQQTYVKAKEKILKSASVGEQKKNLDGFTESFHDGHLRVHWKDDKDCDFTENRIAPEFKITFLDDQIVWVTLPTFLLSDGQQQAFDKVVQDIANFKHKKAVVFDLRGNRGGNSGYGYKLVGSLFGQDYTNQQRWLAYKDAFVDWRASKGNLAHIKSLFALYGSRVVQGLEKAVAQGQDYCRIFNSQPTNSPGQEQCVHGVTAKVFVVIDAANVSAALDFLDAIKMCEPMATLVGQQTKADRLYIDVRGVPLPSGLGTFFFPMKVYRNRPRLDNQPYVPDVVFEDVGNTQQLQKFIVDILEEHV